MEKIVLTDSANMMSVNCYLLANESNDCFIVDPGFKSDEIKSHINNKGYNVVGILLTHGHYDHISGIDCFDVPVYLSEKEVELIDDAYLNGGFYYNIDTTKTDAFNKINFVKEGDSIPFGKESIEVFETPGHTRGSLTYKYKEYLYTGDTLFKSTVGKWDFPTGCQHILKDTVTNMLKIFDSSLIVCPGHGTTTTIEDEIKYNRIFNDWSKGIVYPSTITTQNEKYNVARQLFDDGDFINAKRLFDEIQELEPDNYFISVYVNYSDKKIKENS